VLINILAAYQDPIITSHEEEESKDIE